MSDSWLQVHDEPDINKFDMNNLNLESYTQYFGFTCNSPFNTFSRYYSPHDDINAKKIMGKRLDYIFYRQTPQLVCIDSKVVLTERIPGIDTSYSDHFGVVSVFAISSNPLTAQSCHLNYTHLQSSTVLEILHALKLDQIKAKKDADWLLALFFTCSILQLILLFIIVIVPTCVPEKIVIVLITLFGSLVMNLVSVMIPICLIVGFVFGRTEQRTLLQFIQEIETFQKNMIHDHSMV